MYQSKKLPNLAKWYSKDISPLSFSDKIKTTSKKKPKLRQIIATYAIRSVSRDLPNTVTPVNNIRDTAVSFGAEVNRNW